MGMDPSGRKLGSGGSGLHGPGRSSLREPAAGGRRARGSCGALATDPVTPSQEGVDPGTGGVPRPRDGCAQPWEVVEPRLR